MAGQKEVRIAVAMNGGVSLAVWIGGVTCELARLDRGQDGWAQLSSAQSNVRVDVMVGTSAGGMNAAFLAAALVYQKDLYVVRDLWLDRGGMEPAPGGNPSERLLIDPRVKRPPSLLDGEYLLKGIRAVFEELVDDVPHDDAHEVDVRLTTTSLDGWPADVRDDYGGTFANREYAAAFRFSHALANRENFANSPKDLVVRRLSRAARSTASYPFAFAPSVATPDEAEGVLQPRPEPNGSLLDGGVLDNLPVDEAVRAIFDMPAAGPVQRLFIAVVPDPSTGGERRANAMPSMFDVVTASLSGIPRDRSIAQFLLDVRDRSEASCARRMGRRALLAKAIPSELIAAAGTLWPGYRERRNRQVASALSRELQEKGVTDPALATLDGVRNLLPADVPWMPLDWRAADGVWDGTTVLRLGATILDLLDWADEGAVETTALRASVHAVMQRLHTLNPPALGAYNMATAVITCLQTGDGPAEAVATALEGWPFAGTHQSQQLGGLMTSLAHALIELSHAWVDRPAALQLLGPPEQQTQQARELLAAIEIVGYPSGSRPDDAEQVVKLGILTPKSRALLDPLDRETTADKLAGDEVAHFGAFLRRSWRANDWMWGRLDAITFLARVLGLSDAQTLTLQTKVVEEEAPVLCHAVRIDLDAGARCPLSAILAKNLKPSVEPIEKWDGVVARLGLFTETPHSEFLGLIRIGEEKIKDELWHALLVRVSTRAVAVAVGVLRNAGVPGVQSGVGRMLAPVHGIAKAAYRYVGGIRPNPRSRRASLAAAMTVAVLAGVAVGDLLGIEFGVLAPLAWTGLIGAFLSLALLAPITSAIGAVLIGGVGYTASLPAKRPAGWPRVPGGWGHWWLPVNRGVAIGVIVVALWAMSTRTVEKADDFLLRVFERGQQTIKALSSELGAPE